MKINYGEQNKQDGRADMQVNESDSAGLTRPEHHSYRTFYWRVELMMLEMMMMMLETMKITLMMTVVAIRMLVMMLGMFMTADENTALFYYLKLNSG